LLDRAVAIDPDFALARALAAFNRSDLFVNTNQSAAASESELLGLVERIRSDAERALAMDPNLGWANVAIAQTHMWNWRWSEARRAFDRALEADVSRSSGMGIVYNRYALLAGWLGDTNRSIELTSRTVDLVPNQPGPFFQRGVVYAYAGDAMSSVEALRRAIAIAPDFALAHSWLGFLLRAVGDAGGALAELRLTEQILGDAIPVVFLPELAYAYHLLDRADDAMRLVNEIERRGPGAVGIGGQAMASLAIGDGGEALRLLGIAAEKARREEADVGFLQLMVIKMNVPQDPLLEESEFVRLRNELRGH
jgi:tetratricopeptide (TPR) repeat protein